MAGPAFFVRSCLLTNVVVAGAIVALFLARQQKMQKFIEQAKKEWEETFDIINDAITIHDRDFKIIRANKAASLMLGLPFSVLLQRKCYQCYHGSNYPPQSCPSCKTLTSGKPTVAEVFDDSLNKYLEIKSLPRLDGENRITGVVHVARDITERVNAENRLRTLTLTDDLTGLYNRRGFMAFAEQQQKIALRMNRGYFILFADLDRLKEINDRFGHQEGSDALVRTAAVLRDCFRESDVMARIGGDEFAVYFMENDEASAEILSGRLQARLDEENVRSKRGYRLSISMGFAYCPPRSPRSITDVLNEADCTMYEHKRSRRHLYEAEGKTPRNSAGRAALHADRTPA